MLHIRKLKVDGVLLPGGDLSLLAIRPKSTGEEDGHLSVVLVWNPRKGEYVTWVYDWKEFSCNHGHYFSARNELEYSAGYAAACKDFDERASR